MHTSILQDKDLTLAYMVAMASPFPDRVPKPEEADWDLLAMLGGGLDGSDRDFHKGTGRI